MANEQNNQAQVTQEKYMNAPLWRVFLADLLTKVENWFITKYGTAVSALSQSAWAANNSVDVGMVENAEVLNAMLAEPQDEQIYTTQPAWTFVEDDESVAEGNRTRYQLGSTWTDTSVTPNVTYPIPSLIYDTDGNPHVVFPVWQASGSFQNKYVSAAGQVSDTEQTGYTQKKIFVGSYGFAPMTIEFKKNCNYFGGSLDGHEWKEVATSGTWSGSNVQVTVNVYEKPGTFCRINGTDCGIVTAVSDNGDDTYTLTLGCLCGLVAAGTTVTKVELYKPLQG